MFHLLFHMTMAHVNKTAVAAVLVPKTWPEVCNFFWVKGHTCPLDNFLRPASRQPQFKAKTKMESDMIFLYMVIVSKLNIVYMIIFQSRI